MKTYRTRISILLVIFIGISCYLPIAFIPESDKLFFFLMMTVFFVLIIASLDRLAIHYGKSDVVYISPRHQDDFIAEIEKIRS